MRAALRHHCDVRPRDVIGRVTIRLSIDDFLQATSTMEVKPVSPLIFEIFAVIFNVKIHDVITDVIEPGSTIHVDPIETQHRRRFC